MECVEYVSVAVDNLFKPTHPLDSAVLGYPEEKSPVDGSLLVS
jgi:hypothetical protein